MKITQHKPINKGALLCSVSISIPANLYQKNVCQLIIRDILIYEKNNQKWCSFPSKEYEKDGQKKYWQYIYIPNNEDLKKMQHEIFTELDKYLKEKQQTQTQTQKNDDESLPF